MIYLIALERNPPRVLNSFLEEMTKCCREDYKWRVMPNVWLVDSLFSSEEITNRLKPHLNDRDSFLVIRVVGDFGGYLDGETWDWLNNSLDNGDFGTYKFSEIKQIIPTKEIKMNDQDKSFRKLICWLTAFSIILITVLTINFYYGPARKPTSKPITAQVSENPYQVVRSCQIVLGSSEKFGNKKKDVILELSDIHVNLSSFLVRVETPNSIPTIFNAVKTDSYEPNGLYARLRCLYGNCQYYVELDNVSCEDAEIFCNYKENKKYDEINQVPWNPELNSFPMENSGFCQVVPTHFMSPWGNALEECKIGENHCVETEFGAEIDYP